MGEAKSNNKSQNQNLTLVVVLIWIASCGVPFWALSPADYAGEESAMSIVSAFPVLLLVLLLAILFSILAYRK